eukprot:3197426-Rhodomonas_salina.1
MQRRALLTVCQMLCRVLTKRVARPGTSSRRTRSAARTTSWTRSAIQRYEQRSCVWLLLFRGTDTADDACGSQGSCGSCYAFAAASALGGRICRSTANKWNVVMSPQVSLPRFGRSVAVYGLQTADCTC